MRDVNVMVLRVRQVSRHNRLLLQRAIQTHEEMVRALAPERLVQTYGPAGRLGSALNRAAAALDVAG